MLKNFILTLHSVIILIWTYVDYHAKASLYTEAHHLEDVLVCIITAYPCEVGLMH